MDDLDFGATIKGFSAGQKVFNRYTLKKILGRGGMGVVWLAHDDELERDIALKFLPEVVALDPESVRDMKRETRRSLDLTHPHIIRIHDFVQDARTVAIAMEYVAGSTLSARKLDQPRGCFDTPEIAAWVGQLCAALAYAHREAQIVHRDLKPANLMIDGRGNLKVADFGIAASVSDSVSRVSAQAGSSGTPVFMSPQQMMGDKPAVTDDIYSLGATLYDLLTSKPPFYSGNIMMQVQHKVPPRLADRRIELGVTGEALPPEWEVTIAACLSKEAKDRPQSADEVAERLGLHGGQKRERRAPTESGRANRPAEPLAVRDSAGTSRPTKKALFVALTAGLIVLAGLGWYFGAYAPEQKHQAEVALRELQQKAAADTAEKQRQASEAVKLRTAQAQAAAEAKAKQEQERVAAERLAAARGGLVVRTNPVGAEVRVGAIALDKSPLTLKDQKLGKYPVRVRLAGYEDWTGEVEVKENDFADLDVTLVRSTGTLIITSTPTGAAILQDGKEIGRTPYNNLTHLGPYRFTLQQQGYKAAEVSGEVTRNRELRLTAELEKFRGPEAGQVWTIPDLALTMQPIEPGTFQMGSTNGDADEKPVTQVTLTKAYWLGKTEVTQAQWSALMGSNPSHFKGDDRPVEKVSWDEAMEYCRKLTARERTADRLPAGYVYTLPTEAQWEYACRSGTTGDYAGNLDSIGWFDDNSGHTTHAVGKKQANAWGLSDMHGNVWEWCADWYQEHLPGGSVTDPTSAVSGTYRVLRGGSWGGDATLCRSAVRGGGGPGYRDNNLGFRLALRSVP